LNELIKEKERPADISAGLFLFQKSPTFQDFLLDSISMLKHLSKSTFSFLIPGNIRAGRKKIGLIFLLVWIFPFPDFIFA
jgi:hypothetical protein